jgi:hypothetical protein
VKFKQIYSFQFYLDKKYLISFKPIKNFKLIAADFFLFPIIHYYLDQLIKSEADFLF